ncbi:hypothetical protein TRFO_11084 [Tritrichomonas foetus]|uniref:Uncharacterized protein n=1 Tax=Tritrichomonas foetus TaxID=1144522 RepID=A0A1J4J899_9EUKA|nr:hypothetical protein TRFO_11084 [Tritrichomonas foetus]|eukprot:OHS94471.1 hypothetical protein TRFO_11084 [Tritrichomonas foetus]
MESLYDQNIEKLEQKVQELQRKLDKSQKEKRSLADEVNSLKIHIRKNKRQNDRNTPSQYENNDALAHSDQNRDVYNQFQHQTNYLEESPENPDKIIIENLENEINTFNAFTSSLNFHLIGDESQEALETLNHLTNDTHLKIEDKISPFFTALRSLVVASISRQSRSLKPADLEESRSILEESNNQNQKLINQLEKMAQQYEESQETIKKLQNQIKSEHKMLASFTKNFNSSIGNESSTLKMVDDESFVKSELKLLADAIFVDYSQFQSLIEKDFGRMDQNIFNSRNLNSNLSNGNITLVDLLDYSFAKFQEVDTFIKKLHVALEVDSQNDDFDQLLNVLQEHLAVIPKLQNSVSQLKSEKQILQEHCAEMEKIVQKQSQEFSKSHKSVVSKLQQQIQDLQKRCNDTKLEEITQVLSDKDFETKNLSLRINELEESELKSNKMISQLQTEIAKYAKRYDELNETYEDSKQKLINENKSLKQLTNNLQNQIKQKEMKIKELEDDFSDQITELTNENHSLKNATKYAHKSQRDEELEELQKVSEQNINDLKFLHKKAKKYQNQLRESELSNRDLTLKIEDLNEIQKAQTIKINDLHSKLKQSKAALSQISDEYGSFQQTHLKIVNKFNESQTRIKTLTKQNKQLSKQLSENQNNIQLIESTSCPKAELEKCYRDIQSKDKTIRELKSIVMKQQSSISAFESRQPVLEQFREKYNEEHEVLRVKNLFVTNITAITKDFHSYLTNIIQARPTANLTVINILQKSKPLFDAFSLPMFSFDFIKPISCNLVSSRIANIRPNVDTELLTPEHKVLLTRITDELVDFPVDHDTAYISMNTMLPVSERLKNILELAVSARKVFEERNDSLNALSSLVKNQHSAIIRMSRNSPRKTPTKK